MDKGIKSDGANKFIYELIFVRFGGAKADEN